MKTSVNGCTLPLRQWVHICIQSKASHKRDLHCSDMLTAAPDREFELTPWRPLCSLLWTVLNFLNSWMKHYILKHPFKVQVWRVAWCCMQRQCDYKELTVQRLNNNHISVRNTGWIAYLWQVHKETAQGRPEDCVVQCCFIADGSTLVLEAALVALSLEGAF